MPAWMKSITCRLVHRAHPRLWDLVSIILISTSVNLLTGILPTILGKYQTDTDLALPKEMLATAVWSLVTGILCFCVAGIATENHDKGIEDWERKVSGSKKESILYFAEAASAVNLWTEFLTLAWLLISVLGFLVLSSRVFT